MIVADAAAAAIGPEIGAAVGVAMDAAREVREAAIGSAVAVVDGEKSVMIRFRELASRIEGKGI